MKKLYKAALLAALGLASATVAQAQADTGAISANDLILGFTSTASGVSSDYLLDLGQIPAGQNVQLGGISMTTFNSIFGSALANGQVNAGIIGGAGSGTKDVITSTLDDGTPGDSANMPTAVGSQGNVNNAALTAVGLSLGQQNQITGNGFTVAVAKDPLTAGTAANTFAGYLNSNPLSTIGASEILTLDLWKNTDSGRTSTTGWTYVGDVALDLTGSTLSATFDPVAVPEPATYGAFAGAGLLLLSLRRQLSRKTA